MCPYTSIKYVGMISLDSWNIHLKTLDCWPVISWNHPLTIFWCGAHGARQTYMKEHIFCAVPIKSLAKMDPWYAMIVLPERNRLLLKNPYDLRSGFDTSKLDGEICAFSAGESENDLEAILFSSLVAVNNSFQMKDERVHIFKLFFLSASYQCITLYQWFYLRCYWVERGLLGSEKGKQKMKELQAKEKYMEKAELLRMNCLNCLQCFFFACFIAHTFSFEGIDVLRLWTMRGCFNLSQISVSMSRLCLFCMSVDEQNLMDFVKKSVQYFGNYISLRWHEPPWQAADLSPDTIATTVPSETEDQNTSQAFVTFNSHQVTTADNSSRIDAWNQKMIGFSWNWVNINSRFQQTITDFQLWTALKCCLLPRLEVDRVESSCKQVA